MTMTFSSLTRISVFSLGIAAFTATFAAAQAPVTNLAGMPSFAQGLNGKEVWITADGVRRQGRVTSLSSTDLVLVEDGAPMTIPYKQIVRVEKSTHHLRNGTLIGLAAGAGLGLGIAAGLCDGYCYPGDYVWLSGWYAGLGAAAGVGIGAIVKSTTKHDNVIYDVRRDTRTIAVAPIISPTRKGASVSLTWR